MNLNHLNIFYAVAEEGSISRGAERLYISQPAVSKQLAEFERALGTPLFDRLPKGVRLTEAGRVLQGYARRLFALEAEAERALRELRGLERGRLSIGASTTIGGYLLPSALARFHAAYPAIDVDLEIGNTETIQRALEEGCLDLGFTEGFVHSDALDAHVFYQDELVFIAACDYVPLAGEAFPLPLERVCAEPFLVRERGSGTRAVTEEALRQQGITLRPVMTLGTTEAIKRAVADKIGIALVSRLTVDNDVRDGRLIKLPVQNFTLHRPLHRLQVRGRHFSPAVQAFLQNLHESLGTM